MTRVKRAAAWQKALRGSASRGLEVTMKECFTFTCSIRLETRDSISVTQPIYAGVWANTKKGHHERRVTVGPWKLIYYEAYTEEATQLEEKVTSRAGLAENFSGHSFAIISSSIEPREAKPFTRCSRSWAMRPTATPASLGSAPGPPPSF